MGNSSSNQATEASDPDEWMAQNADSVEQMLMNLINESEESEGDAEGDAEGAERHGVGAELDGNIEHNEDADRASVDSRKSFKAYGQQDVLRLLYLIAEDQTTSSAVVHRGVSCNYCGMSPIRGIRYHCSECVDVDLCQGCESSELHKDSHLLLKIKVPIPIMRNPTWVRNSWRPLASQKADHLREKVAGTAEESKLRELELVNRDLSFSNFELAAIYDQFKTLADVQVINGPNVIYRMSRDTFKACLFPEASADSAIFQRTYSLYDQKNNGFVQFADVAQYRNIVTRGDSYSKLLYAFRGFDLDDDGVVSMDDILKVLSEAYDITKTRILNRPEGDFITSRLLEPAWTDNRPLSTLFLNSISPSQGLPEKSSLTFANADSIVDAVNYEFQSSGNIDNSTSSDFTYTTRELDNNVLKVSLPKELEKLFQQLGWVGEASQVHYVDEINTKCKLIFCNENYAILVRWLNLGVL